MRIGIDLGGTKTEIIALSDDGTELLRQRRPTPAQSYDGIIATVAGLVEEAEARLSAKGTIGVAIPGAISPWSGLVKNANTVCLIGRALDQDLARALGRPVRLANDANCFALSEAVDGAAAGDEVVFGVILGTGTGGGIVVNGRELRGPNAIAGEWGHNPLPWPMDDERPGPPCYCGKQGCIETFISGPGLARSHRQRTGEEALPPLLDERARSGDQSAETTLRIFEDRVARSLAVVMNILDPDTIVLGGGLSNLQRLYQNVPEIWGRYVFSDRVKTKLVRARHGDSSGVRGAAWLWPARS